MGLGVDVAVGRGVGVGVVVAVGVGVGVGVASRVGLGVGALSDGGGGGGVGGGCCCWEPSSGIGWKKPRLPLKHIRTTAPTLVVL